MSGLDLVSSFPTFVVALQSIDMYHWTTVFLPIKRRHDSQDRWNDPMIHNETTCLSVSQGHESKSSWREKQQEVDQSMSVRQCIHSQSPIPHSVQLLLVAS